MLGRKSHFWESSASPGLCGLQVKHQQQHRLGQSALKIPVPLTQFHPQQGEGAAIPQSPPSSPVTPGSPSSATLAQQRLRDGCQENSTECKPGCSRKRSLAQFLLHSLCSAPCKQQEIALLALLKLSGGVELEGLMGICSQCPSLGFRARGIRWRPQGCRASNTTRDGGGAPRAWHIPAGTGKMNGFSSREDLSVSALMPSPLLLPSPAPHMCILPEPLLLSKCHSLSGLGKGDEEGAEMWGEMEGDGRMPGRSCRGAQIFHGTRKKEGEGTLLSSGRDSAHPSSPSASKYQMFHWFGDVFPRPREPSSSSQPARGKKGCGHLPSLPSSWIWQLSCLSYLSLSRALSDFCSMRAAAGGLCVNNKCRASEEAKHGGESCPDGRRGAQLSRRAL